MKRIHLIISALALVFFVGGCAGVGGSSASKGVDLGGQQIAQVPAD
jgi:hypothetical protein